MTTATNMQPILPLLFAGETRPAISIPKIRYDLGWRDYGAYDENDLGPTMMAKYKA